VDKPLQLNGKSFKARTAGLTSSAQNLGGQRQFHLLWSRVLGRISAKEHADIFLYARGGIIGSQDHACVEGERRIGKRLYDNTVSLNI
jgi:hypothetical protein